MIGVEQVWRDAGNFQVEEHPFCADRFRRGDFSFEKSFTNCEFVVKY
jgi:hypothetical protein